MKSENINDEQKDATISGRRRWTVGPVDRRRRERRVKVIKVDFDRRSGKDRRSLDDRRRGLGRRPCEAVGSRVPITSWLAQRVPDDFLRKSGDTITRIKDIVCCHWGRYEHSAQAELVHALTPILDDLTGTDGHLSDIHRERCEREILSWLSRHSPTPRCSKPTLNKLKRAS